MILPPAPPCPVCKPSSLKPSSSSVYTIEALLSLAKAPLLRSPSAFTTQLVPIEKASQLTEAPVMAFCLQAGHCAHGSPLGELFYLSMMEDHSALPKFFDAHFLSVFPQIRFHPSSARCGGSLNTTGKPHSFRAPHRQAGRQTAILAGWYLFPHLRMEHLWSR